MADPICRVLPIALSTYRAHAARRVNADEASALEKRDALLRQEIRRVWNENSRVHGVRRVRRQLVRERFDVARCTVSAL